MNATKLLTALTLCVFLCVMLGMVVDQAHAQSRSLGKAAGAAGMGMGGDKDLATKKGLAVFDTKRKSDPTKVANGLQKTVGVGSIFVMIAVMKWL